MAKFTWNYIQPETTLDKFNSANFVFTDAAIATVKRAAFRLFPPGIEQNENTDDKFSNSFETQEFDVADGVSVFGTSVYGRLTFIPKSYEIPGVNYSAPPNLFESKEIIIDTAIISLNKSKSIVETMLQGRNGSIKEYIATGDFRISIQGVLTNNKIEDLKKYPKEEVKNLHDLLNINKPIYFYHSLLNLLGIDKMVVKSFSFSQQQGVINAQSFKIEAVSD